ncbi:olfactory receptor 10V1-like [Pongo pygmaeus]|uniref:olfactory receptor 10V1-like n=1 Tax=Pongo pygmaeus TaxID=9600 RepID=UPI0023E15224|nr:olfactory receptor 10V1-like [Pongo pygmaeus]
MYFFLTNFAALEIFYFFTIAPLTLANVLSMGRNLISLPSCGAQMFFIFLGRADCILLAVMAFDWFVAICHPLCYGLIMSWRLCVQLTLGSLLLGFFLAMQLTVLIFQLPLCSSKQISTFYCDVLPVMRLACVDTWVHEATLSVVSITVLTIPFLLITLSYVFIMAAILKPCSAEGRHKAFSTFPPT